MNSKLKTIVLSLVLLAVLDIVAAVALASVAPASLVRFFDYGRSVPGKIAKWEAEPDTAGNLYDVAWIPEGLEQSRRLFQEEAGYPIVRVYGMSFVNQIADAAKARRPDLIIDKHSGPAAPPNFTYAFFLDDSESRRAGDIVLLGILSSSVPAMAALSNRTWAFEQPAPFTYPIFMPTGAENLVRVDPVVGSLSDQMSLANDEGLRTVWQRQLATVDRFYSAAAFALPKLDISPLARLVRRSLATSAIEETEARILASPNSEPYPYEPALKQMVKRFAQIARDERQLPIVVLVQSRNSGDVDLMSMLGDEIRSLQIPYLATSEIQSIDDPAAFLVDGHYTEKVNAIFGKILLNLIELHID